MIVLGPIFRIIHWVIALVVLLNAFVLEEGKIVHRYIGYTAVAMVVLRILISKKRKIEHYNPKAIYVYALMWICILGLGVTGFMMGLDKFWGNKVLEEIHEVISGILLALTGIHLAGVFYDAFTNKRSTWIIMITGKKE